MDFATFYKTVFEILIFLKNLVQVVVSTGTTVTLRLIDASRPREYIFLKGYTTPFLAHQVKTTSPGVPDVTWTYNLDTNILVRGADTSHQNLPWLSASICYNGMNLYSMDDFISNVKFASSNNDAPPPAVIVGAWSLYTGIVLNNQLTMELSVISDEGEVLIFSPWALEMKAKPMQRVENLYIESGPTERVVTTSPPPVMSDIEFVDYMMNNLDDMPNLENERA
jgi:hypothetical protein